MERQAAEGAMATGVLNAAQRKLEQADAALGALRAEHAAVSAQAEERAVQIETERAAAAQRDAGRRAETEALTEALSVSEGHVRAGSEKLKAAEASLAGDDVRWASDQEISDYAEYLGMDPAEDGPLLWIAEHAVCSPVPDGWKESEDHTGRTFFYHAADGSFQYEHPYDADYIALYETMKAGLWEPATMEEVLDMAGFLGIDPEAEPRLMWIAKQACLAPLPEGWAELEDPAGQPYYYHAATDRSTRAHPLDATFQVLLKMERARLGKWSFSRAANIGLAEGEAPMRLLEADGSALYTYDWCKKTRGEEVGIPPILAEAAPAAAAAVTAAPPPI